MLAAWKNSTSFWPHILTQSFLPPSSFDILPCYLNSSRMMTLHNFPIVVFEFWIIIYYTFKLFWSLDIEMNLIWTPVNKIFPRINLLIVVPRICLGLDTLIRNVERWTMSMSQGLPSSLHAHLLQSNDRAPYLLSQSHPWQGRKKRSFLADSQTKLWYQHRGSIAWSWSFQLLHSYENFYRTRLW
jgi:hypothetical protein